MSEHDLPFDATVNGLPVSLEIPAGRTLAELVREDLGLTGTKVSCAMGICGACSVLVDGRSVSACTTLAADAEGTTITTVEGLAGPDGTLSALQAAFIRHGALQCGYCTPGFLAAATELLARTPAPDEAQVKAALEGNICRCTGYRPIVAAVLDAAEAAAAEAAAAGGPAGVTANARHAPDHHGGPTPGFTVIGSPVPRVDARAKVTGAAAFVGDLAVAGLLHGAVVRSDVPHGRIVAIDAAEALAVSGVLRVVTFADLKSGLRGTHYGPVVRDCPLLADGVVRYEGEPIAVVVARDAGTARRAARLVRVDIEDLPRIVDVVAAMDDAAPRLHAGDGAATAAKGEFGGAWADGWEPARNIAGQYHDARGDVDAALAAADRVFEGVYTVPSITPASIENQVATAIPSPGGITVRGSHQYPYLTSTPAGALVGLP